ncbi:MAG: Flp pilus assembly complex ATPase component TadA [Firmicutes bacterium]|nr:Flp pilus assembly complex ATPase component TadA [Bacillota bacterium]
MMLFILTAIIIAVVILFIRRANKSDEFYHKSVDMTFERLQLIVRDELSEMVKEDTFAGLDDAALNSALKIKGNIIKALKNCVYGIDSDKEIVINLIVQIIANHCPTDDDLQKIIKFGTDKIDVQVMFEILMYEYGKSEGRDALNVFIEKYKLAEPKYVIEDKTKPSYRIDADEIRQIYNSENIELTYNDKCNVLAILIFQKYKGFGCIDTIRASSVNGVNIGTSGSIIQFFGNRTHVAENSIWINYKGKQIHMAFLDMGTEEETRRIVQAISRWNSPGPLTEKRGYLVNTMYDKSRVLAVRPPMSEYWAVFIRKFELCPLTLHQLIYKDYITNWELAEYMIKYLMMGQVTTAFTGRQGSGKTTMMAGAIEHIDPCYTIRVIEMAPELYLREMYPERNILSLQETEFVSAAEAQDALKKSDGAVSLFGEVATDDVAMRMIQTAQVASLFTIFSHHANTASDLVYAIRNSVANVGNITNIKTAEDQVVSVLKVNVHLDYTTAGKRFIERITEIIKLDEGVPYPELDKKNLEWSKSVVEKEYYTRTTDRKTFITKDLIVYDACIIGNNG